MPIAIRKAICAGKKQLSSEQLTVYNRAQSNRLGDGQYDDGDADVFADGYVALAEQLHVYADA